MNKFWKSVISLTLVTGVLTGCTKVPEEKPETIQTINLVMDEQYLQVFNSVFQDFENSNPNIKISASSFPSEDEYKRMLYISSFNEQETDFDLYCMPSPWITEFAAKNYIQPVKNLADVMQKQFSSQALEMFTVSDELYALPLFMDTWVMYYRKDKVGDNGWQNDLSRVGLPNINDSNVVDFILSYAVSNNNDVAEAIKLYKSWNDKADRSVSNSVDTFINGNTDYLWGRCEDKGVIDNVFSEVKGKTATSQIAGKKFLVSGTGIAVSSKLALEKKDAVKRFINFVNSNAIYIEVSKNLMTLPVVENLEQHHLILDSLPIAKTIFSTRENVVALKSKPHSFELRQEAKEKLSYYIEGKISLNEVCDAFILLF